MKTVDYANKYLFGPLGIAPYENYYAESADEHKGFILLKKPKANWWFVDSKGIGTAGYGLCMSSINLAKIGVMCLNKGVNNGQRIISEQWFDLITTVTHQCDERFGNLKYGHLFWILDEDKKIYAALGNSGNVLYIKSNNKIIISVTSYFKPTVFDRLTFIREHLEPNFLK